MCLPLSYNFNDALFVPGFSTGYKADLQAQHIFYRGGGFFLGGGGDVGVGVQSEPRGEVTEQTLAICKIQHPIHLHRNFCRR